MSMVDELIKDITRSVEYLDSHFTINVNDVHKPEGKSLVVSVPLAVVVYTTMQEVHPVPENAGAADCTCVSSGAV